MRGMFCRLLSAGIFLSLGFATGCGGSGGGGGQSPIVTITPSSAQAMDQGQTLPLTATVQHDNTAAAGASWTVSGGGTLTSVTTTSATYNPPATVAAPITASVTATSIAQTSVSASVLITVNPAPAVSTTTLPAATVGTAYNTTLNSTGGTGAITWSLAPGGSLPAGLTLNASTGVISGTPTASGTSTITLKITDSSPIAAVTATSGSLTLTVNGPPLSVTAPTLSSAIVGKAYTSLSFTSTGGTAPITWSATGLPTGLAINSSTGIISGNATTAGTSSNVVVTATDAGVGPVQQTKSTTALTLNVRAVLGVTTSSLTAGSTGVAYNTTLVASGGLSPYTWSATGVPAGLTLSAAGVLSGTPTTLTGSPFTIAVTATDSDSTNQQTANANLSLTINAGPPIISTTTLPGATVGTAYSQTLAYTYGNGGTVVWAVTSGALPSGLSINAATGVISGTPAVGSTGTATFTVTVTVGGVASVGQQLSIVVSPAAIPVVTTSSLPNATVSSAYSQQLTCTSCSGTQAWASLPSSGTGSLAAVGLSLNASSGLISGTPPATGSVNITVVVSANGQTAVPVPLSFSVSPSGVPLAIAAGAGTTLTGEVGLPFGIFFTATGGVPPYSWSISSGTLPSPLAISNSSALNSNIAGLISGTPTATASGTNVTVKVTDHINNTATQSYTINIAANTARTGSNAELTGQYAFYTSGFDAAGNPLMRAGSFTANGTGSITTGSFDSNGTGTSTPSLNIAMTGGSYSVGSNGSGMLTTTSSGGSSVYVISVDKITSGVAVSGYMTLFNASGSSQTGRFQQQSSSAFSTASVTGGYAIGLQGFKAGSTASNQTHSGVIGELQLNNGSITSGQLLASDSGSTTPSTLNSGGTYTISSGTGSANGRGTMTFSITAGTSTQTIDLVFYIVDATKAFFISSDPTNTSSGPDLLSGQVAQQAVADGSFTVANLTGATVIHASGLASSPGFGSTAELGVLTWSGTGTVSYSLDTNSEGTSDGVASGGTGPWTPTSGTGAPYTVTSHGLATIGSGTSGTYVYLAATNSGFSMDFSGNVYTGGIEPQTSTTFPSGSFSAGTFDPVAQNTAYYALELTNSSGNLSINEDSNQTAYLQPDIAITSTFTAAANGRVVLVTGGGGAPPIMYIVGNNKFYLLSLSSGNPVLTEFTHQ
jgi:hypothetical protein